MLPAKDHVFKLGDDIVTLTTRSSYSNRASIVYVIATFVFYLFLFIA